MIEVEDLTVAYGSVRAVRGVSFQVAPGEVVALLGRNGAGKTSTMQVLAGHRAATSGRVRVAGGDPYRDRATVRRHVGIMLQEAGFLGELTVAETVQAWRRFGRDPLPRDEVLDLVDLRAQARIRVGRLSGGQRRRLDLALAILHRPRVLFLDEPTTGLDPEARQNTWQVIEGLAQADTTVLLTTHYLQEAERLAGRVLMMEAGRLTVSGDLPTVLSAGTGTVSFAADRLPEDLPADWPAEYAAGRVVIRTRRLDETAAEVFAWAATRGRVLPQVAVRPASLEDVYLGLTEDRQRGPVDAVPEKVGHR
ncbi:ABC transporter ATP-binding protein [Micromonospora gifhornensis]|uniref:ABC-type transporter, ATPase component n=1 Tax=Verrucosispora sp. MS100047 TaxID=1410949 RepID=A0A097CRM0_9ACTN|nr:ABC transporter ATP-binding protein [Verrucosispora sp. FIM060022]AIS85280.1 ABC-type transporter, ATPase component [Verrucosispora sp. MS100047]RUL90670.1 ABC transporter ATP-binding protein [Verrucosispora sp. FIM060022]